MFLTSRASANETKLPKRRLSKFMSTDTDPITVLQCSQNPLWRWVWGGKGEGGRKGIGSFGPSYTVTLHDVYSVGYILFVA